MNTWSIPIPIITVMSKRERGAFVGLRIGYEDEGQIGAALLKLEGYARNAAAREGRDMDRDNLFLIGIVMPCGARFLFRRAEDIPREDVPCPCGDPLHTIVRYERKEERVPVGMWP